MIIIDKYYHNLIVVYIRIIIMNYTLKGRMHKI